MQAERISNARSAVEAEGRHRAADRNMSLTRPAQLEKEWLIDEPNVLPMTDAEWCHRRAGGRNRAGVIGGPPPTGCGDCDV
jgi:hypothetical protein